MSHHACAIGSLWDTDSCTQHREMEHPFGCMLATFGYHQLVVEKPQAYCLAYDHHRQGNGTVDDHSGGECVAQTVGIASAKFEGDEAGNACAQCPHKEGEDSKHPSGHCLESIILHSKSFEHDAHGEYSYHHGDDASGVEIKGVFSYTQISCHVVL